MELAFQLIQFWWENDLDDDDRFPTLLSNLLLEKHLTPSFDSKQYVTSFPSKILKREYDWRAEDHCHSKVVLTPMRKYRICTIAVSHNHGVISTSLNKKLNHWDEKEQNQQNKKDYTSTFSEPTRQLVNHSKKKQWEITYQIKFTYLWKRPSTCAGILKYKTISFNFTLTSEFWCNDEDILHWTHQNGI